MCLSKMMPNLLRNCSTTPIAPQANYFEIDNNLWAISILNCSNLNMLYRSINFNIVQTEMFQTFSIFILSKYNNLQTKSAIHEQEHNILDSYLRFTISYPHAVGIPGQKSLLSRMSIHQWTFSEIFVETNRDADVSWALDRRQPQNNVFIKMQIRQFQSNRIPGTEWYAQKILIILSWRL